MIEICPNCLYRATEEEHKISPLSCPRCECLYSARDYVNEEKRRKNQERKAWRVTRWRPKYRTGFALGIPAVMVIMYATYYIGHFIIANSRPISNELYVLTKKEEPEARNQNKAILPIQPANMPQKATEPQAVKRVPVAKEQAPRTALPPPSKKTGSIEKGVLTVTSKKEIFVLFSLAGTGKKFGPYKLNSMQPTEILLERGVYRVHINEGGKKSSTTMNFVSGSGKLNL